MTSAISTSMSVKPSLRSRASGAADWDNLNSAGQPIDANLESAAGTQQRDRTAARHSRREEIDRASGSALIAARGKQRIEPNIARKHDRAARCAGTDRMRDRIEF